MFCKNCGNKSTENNLFCNHCGTKREPQKFKPSLGNLIIFWGFISNMLLVLAAIFIGVFKSLDSSGGSGFFLIIIPFMPIIIVLTQLLPQLIGVILSRINLKKNNYIMLVFIFIASIISLVLTLEYSFSYSGISGILFWIGLILNIILCIITLLKLIFKNMRKW